MSLAGPLRDSVVGTGPPTNLPLGEDFTRGPMTVDRVKGGTGYCTTSITSEIRGISEFPRKFSLKF